MSSTTQPSRSVLGKGLASLLPGVATAHNAQAANNNGVGAMAGVSARTGVPPEAPEVSGASRHMGISVMPVDQIKANEFQPRRDFDPVALEELAQSIRENGLIQPLIIRKNGENYELIAGERRLRACKIAGLKMVPVVIRRSTDREALELAIVENIQREDLNCVDEALAYFQLLQEFQLSQEELAKKMGKERATVANALRILKLSDSIITELKKGNLTRGHAKALLAVEDVPERQKLAEEVLAKNLSVRQTEKRSQEMKGMSAEVRPVNLAKKPESKINPELMKSTQTLTRKFMTKVDIKGDQKNGTIQLHYSSADELSRVLNLLMGE